MEARSPKISLKDSALLQDAGKSEVFSPDAEIKDIVDEAKRQAYSEGYSDSSTLLLRKVFDFEKKLREQQRDELKTNLNAVRKLAEERKDLLINLKSIR